MIKKEFYSSKVSDEEYQEAVEALAEENKLLKFQVEKMKDCQNCKYDEEGLFCTKDTKKSPCYWGGELRFWELKE